MALAPSLPLLGVPSRSSSSRSMADLVAGVLAEQAGAMVSLTLCDGLEDALAEVALLVAVAQLDGFVGAGAGAAGHGGPADGAVVQDDFDLDRGVAAAVEDFAGVNVR